MKCSEINKMIEENRIEELVNTDESRFKKQITALVSDIEENNDKLVMVSGPTSSGKTTFGTILSKELKSRGYETLLVSLDDYFFGKKFMAENIPEVDFESVLSLDMDLFKENIKDILAGKTVMLPRFNFISGEREEKLMTFTPQENLIIFVEGIHALSKAVLSSVGSAKTLKVFICPKSRIELSNGTLLNGTYMRLIRRTVRDYNYRNADAKRTFDLWQDVRKSEIKYIIPSAKKADVIIDSCFYYELCVLKNQAIYLLSMISKDSPYRRQASRLINILKQFNELPESVVPKNSLLREFIGN